MCEQRRPRSSCASLQSDLTNIFYNIPYMGKRLWFVPSLFPVSAIRSFHHFFIQYSGKQTWANSVWFEVLRPCQPVKFMSSQSVYLITLLLCKLQSSKRITSTWAQSFDRNWQLSFLNQNKQCSPRSDAESTEFGLGLHCSPLVQQFSDPSQLAFYINLYKPITARYRFM